jgi:hypothetical protein
MSSFEIILYKILAADRMSVLRQETSHLLLIRTNLGYGNVLTAACPRPGRSVTHYLLLWGAGVQKAT